MTPLYLYNGKLLIVNGALANSIDCCCSTECTASCININCLASDLFDNIDCNRAGIHKHIITIPEEYSLPVPINITGSVDDDLLIDGQSVSDDYEPGSYIDPDTNCIVAHTIGDQPGPFKDPVNGGITFPINNRVFEISLRDTLMINHALNITVCVDPNNTQNVCLPIAVSGCCGATLYCYEKTSPECVERICSTEISEEGWVQIGGPYTCTCSDCDTTGTCNLYTEWRIIDDNNYIYAKGFISYDTGSFVGGYLDDLPNPFEPLFYESTGSKNFKLQAYCFAGSEWHDLHTWPGTIVICAGMGDRYPSSGMLNPYGGWGAQGDCALPVNENGDHICNADPCSALYPGAWGDGQAWRDPQPGAAYKFTGAVDGEWTNLNNWQDSAGLSPAASLPMPNYSNIVIDGGLTSKPNDLDVVVGSVTVTANGSIGIIMSCGDLYCEGNVTGVNACPGGGVGGQVTCSNSCIFDNGGYITGIVSVTNNTIAEFKNGSYVSSGGEVNGDSKFTQNSYNSGYLNGNAKFYNTSYNQGAINGSAEFRDSAHAKNNSSIYSETNFYGSSYSEGTVEFNVLNYWETSYNLATSMNNNSSTVSFNGNSRNEGYVGNAGLPPTACDFNGNSINKSNGTVVSVTASIGVNAINKGSITIDTGSICNIFGLNDTTGSITMNDENGVAFDGTSSINRGTVIGKAVFTNGACNDGGTATTFVPDPPPSC